MPGLAPPSRLENSIFPLTKKFRLKILSQARRTSTVDGGDVISEIEDSNTMYTLIHVKNCYIVGYWLFIDLFVQFVNIYTPLIFS